jgi:hypothetical protein
MAFLSDSNGVYKDEESLAEFDNISKRRSYRNNDKTITTLNLVLKKKHLNGSFFSINLLHSINNSIHIT